MTMPAVSGPLSEAETQRLVREARSAKHLPPTVTIGPHAYEIRADEETRRHLVDSSDNGNSVPDRLLVRIDTDRPHTAVAETLLHELMHCAWDQTSLRRQRTADEQEDVVTALAPLLLGMLRGNPALVAYLTDGAS